MRPLTSDWQNDSPEREVAATGVTRRAAASRVIGLLPQPAASA